MGVERISLAGHGALTRSEVHDWQLRRAVTFSQRVLVASPRSTYLAYADGADLVIRSARGEKQRIGGVYQRDARFSLDDEHLAVVRTSEPGRLGVSVYDLATGKHRVLAEVGSAEWIEWVAGGVVVSERHQDGMMLRYLPLEGRPRLLLQDKELAARFTTAKSGSRVLAFVGGQATLLDTTSAEVQALGAVAGEVTNAEMAADGSEAAFTTASAGLHRWDGSGIELLDDDRTIHTVWYWRGTRRLAYASPSGVTVRDGDRIHERPSKRHEIAAMRFDPVSGGVLVSEGRTLTLWRPASGRSKLLKRAPSGQLLRGADRFAGGTAVWTYERAQRRPAQKPPVNPFAEPPPQRQAVNAPSARN